MINIERIEILIENNKLEEQDSLILQLFLDAVNDWPGSAETLEEYVDRVEIFIGGESTFENISKKINGLPLKYAWEMESLTQILNVFIYYKSEKTLRDILISINKYLEK